MLLRGGLALAFRWLVRRSFVQRKSATDRRGRDLVQRPGERRLVVGNSVWPLRDGEEAYPEMLAAIAAAQRSISLSTYLFDNDPLGRRFANALAAAVTRGVAVRVLVDDLGARYTYPSITRVLREAGVDTGLL